MAEADWQAEGVELLTDDPLLIGERDGTFYLLECFDPTPLESFVRETFSEDGNLRN